MTCCCEAPLGAVSELVLEPAPDLLSFNQTAHLEGL